MAALSTARVLGAIYELNARQGRWPTSAEITKYLDTNSDEVKAHLATLRESRMFRDRIRDKRKVWMPWGAP